MAKKLTIFNMKGGVGKSATATNLAAGLVKFKKKRVLLVDIDPQGTSGASLGLEVWNLGTQLKDVLRNQEPENLNALLKAAILSRVSASQTLLTQQFWGSSKTRRSSKVLYWGDEWD